MGSGGIGCGASIAKILLFVFNVVFFLAGAGLMGVGIWIRVDPRSAQFARILSPAGAGDPLLQTAAIVVAAIGGFIFLVGFFGCAGACCENTCMLTTYATIVIILAIAQIAAGITAAVFAGRIQSTIGKAMDEGMDRYKSQGGALRTAWDSMQVWLQCCGRHNSSDWSKGDRAVRDNATVPNNWQRDYPPSCCKLTERDPNKITGDNMVNETGCRNADPTAMNTKGCEQSLVDWFRRHAGIIMGVAFGVVAIQFIVAAMACCLRSAINEDKKGYVA